MYSKEILLVEDEPSIAEVLVHLLKNEGFLPTMVETISDARVSIRKVDFAAIILDVELPDGNGIDFCREIRKTSKTPILFLTCRGSVDEQTVGLQLADDYVVKPFENKVVLERIKNIIKRKGGPESSVKDSKFHLDEDRKKIAYQGETIKATPAEYKMLELFITHPGKVYSRESIYNFCWPDNPERENSDDFLRTVDTHIKTIREKMRKIDSEVKPEDIIKTTIKIGYSLDE
jgi:two-component system, OmpR family, catabolic regulation response regulator CreB